MEKFTLEIAARAIPANVVPYSGIWETGGIFAKFAPLIMKPADAKAFEHAKKYVNRNIGKAIIYKVE
ncbi:MAG TPA: hypothetical protein ENI76_01030 [Ignavibacteria bacterium]|nr:hypothetical protein [Ignavibacteria bacterium]